MNLIEDQLKPFKIIFIQNTINLFSRVQESKDKTNTHCRIIQEARPKKMALKSKKMLPVIEDIIGRSLRKEATEWTLENSLKIGPNKYNKTVTYFLKNSFFSQMSNCLFLRKNPTILQKENLSSFLSLIGAFLSSIRSEKSAYIEGVLP